MPRRTLPALLAVSALLAAPTAAGAEPFKHRTQATAQGTGGAAATVDSVATSAARAVLRRGGNAVDAAVAAAAVLGVTEPFSAGIGGGGFMVIRTPRGNVTTLDSRETAPAAMRPESFIENGRALSMDDARYSGLSAGVPGTVHGWKRALRRHGSWRFKRVLAPAIRVAEEGFVVDDTFARQTTPNIPWFNDIPSTAALYLDPDGTAKDPGSVVRNPDLARTYRRIARLGVNGFYRGPVAEAIAAAAQAPPTGAGADKTWRPGLMTVADIQRYRALRRRPTLVGYHHYDVYSIAPPSSGGSTVGQALNILERIPGYRHMPEEDKLHYFLEASRYAFADRNVFVADPAFVRVPLRGLLSDAYAAERAALITGTDPNTAVPPGDPWRHQGDATVQPAAGPSSFSPTQSTTHVTVADRRGMVVSYTFTIESTGGNGIVVPGWGFLLNNELTDFNYDNPQHANAPAAGKRPRSSIAPTYVERNGRPFLAVGSPGGATIITTVLQILTARIDFGHTLPQAIVDPRASQRNPARTATNPNSPTAPEQAFLDTHGAELRARGHTFSTPAEIGAATGIEFLPGGGFLAAAEPTRRGGGSAQVVRP
jgi:gamma-glutamyltranspeptidase/glutathione hydrolase